MRGKLVIAVIVAALGSLVVASSASAIVVYNSNSVTFTKAIATPDWSKTSFSGTMNYSSCNAGCESWLVLIYAEPTVYKCEAEDWLYESDPNIHQVWNSHGQTGNKTLPFEASESPLIPGVLGQKLCVVGIQTTYSMFWEENIIEETLIGQTLLTVYTPPPAAAPASAAEESKPTPSKACRRARHKVNHLMSQRDAARKAGKTKATHRLNKAIRKAKNQRKAKC